MLRRIALALLVGNVVACRTTDPTPTRPAPVEPSLGSWTTLATTNRPVARHECAFVAVGQRLVLLGGRGAKPVEIFDLATSTWSPGASPPLELHHFQAVTFENRVYVLGALTGGYPAETPVPEIHVYDAASDRWSTAGAIPEARRRGAAGVALVDGRMYLAGGLTEGHNGGFVPWLDRYDPKTGTWETLPDAPRPRDHFHAAAARGRLWLAGGRTTSARTGHVLDLTIAEVDVFDLAAKAWSTLPAALPTLRAGTSSVVIGDELLVLGGESGTQKPAHAEVEALDLATGRFRALAPLARGRHGTGAAVIAGRLYVAAGSGNRGGGPELDSVEAWTR